MSYQADDEQADTEPLSFTFSPDHPIMHVRRHTLEIHTEEDTNLPASAYKLLMLCGSEYSQTGTLINRERLGELIGFLMDAYLDWGEVPE